MLMIEYFSASSKKQFLLLNIWINMKFQICSHLEIWININYFDVIMFACKMFLKKKRKYHYNNLCWNEYLSNTHKLMNRMNITHHMEQPTSKSLQELIDSPSNYEKLVLLVLYEMYLAAVFPLNFTKLL